MTTTYTEYLWKTGTAGALSSYQSVWVKFTNNETAVAYISTAITDSQGKFTISNIPAGIYTVSTSLDGISYIPTGNTSWNVSYIPGDDMVGVKGFQTMPFLATQGLYARTVPAPSGEAYIIPFVGPGGDPNNLTYLWAWGVTSGKIGYSSNSGATFSAVIANPNPAHTIVQILITTNFMWVLTTASLSKSGQLWRSPSPNATGSNLAFTKIFDLTGLVNGPGGAVASGPSNSCFRNSCLAVQANESKVYLLTYGGGNDALALGGSADVLMAAGSDLVYSPSSFAGAVGGWTVGATVTVTGAGASGALLTSTCTEVISLKKIRLADCAQTTVSGATFNSPSQSYGSGAVIGGPFFYVSSNANGVSGSITFSLAANWVYAKHGHAVRIIGGVPWVSLGDVFWPSVLDGVQPVTNVGVLVATDATGTAWTFKFNAAYGSAFAFDVINFYPITVGGQAMIVGESDSNYSPGPVFALVGGAKVQLIPFQPMVLPQVTTMRCLCVTPEGNLMWMGTGEGGAVGPVATIMLAKAPFSQWQPPIVLETSTTDLFGSPASGDAVIDGAYVWFGNLRIAREKFVGQ